jgi:hypothetical protein
VVQYYRASSVSLAVDGYNDTSLFGANATADGDVPHTPLPAWVNASALACVNKTIGAAVPLFDADNDGPSSGSDGSGPYWSGAVGRVEMQGVVGMMWVVWVVLAMLF